MSFRRKWTWFICCFLVKVYEVSLVHKIGKASQRKWCEAKGWGMATYVLNRGESLVSECVLCSEVDWRREQIQRDDPQLLMSHRSVCKCALCSGRHHWSLSEDILSKPEHLFYLVQSVGGLCRCGCQDSVCISHLVQSVGDLCADVAAKAVCAFPIWLH